MGKRYYDVDTDLWMDKHGHGITTNDVIRNLKRVRAITVVAVILTIIVAFIAGVQVGITHVIVDSEMWTVDRYDPDNPDESAWNGYDQLIFIELDGQLYEHGMYQG